MSGARGHVHMTLRLPDRTGAAKMALGFARAFRDNTHAVTLIHGSVPAGEPSIVSDFEEMGASTVFEPRLDRPWSPRLPRAISERAQADGSSCIIGVNQRDRATAVLAARRARLPGIVMVQNQHHFWGNAATAMTKRVVYSRGIRRADLAVCTSDVVRDQIVGFGLAPDRAVVLPNGIDLDAVRPEEMSPSGRARLRASLGEEDDRRLLLLSIGRLDPQKGHDVLVEALREAPDLSQRVRLVIVGSGGGTDASRERQDFVRRLRKQAQMVAPPGTVEFAGWRSDVPSVLAVADGYVHSARWEGPALPLAVMEAMASGCPTVFTDCSGEPPWYVDGTHGLMAQSDDAASLREALRRLTAMSPSERAELGKHGAQLIRDHYDLEDVAQQFVALVTRTWR
jgi:glycosyltransferase involved in cell wall biosynthesis